jgi:hypothetical protein
LFQKNKNKNAFVKHSAKKVCVKKWFATYVVDGLQQKKYCSTATTVKKKKKHLL